MKICKIFNLKTAFMYLWFRIIVRFVLQKINTIYKSWWIVIRTRAFVDEPSAIALTASVEQDVIAAANSTTVRNLNMDMTKEICLLCGNPSEMKMCRTISKKYCLGLKPSRKLYRGSAL